MVKSIQCLNRQINTGINKDTCKLDFIQLIYHNNFFCNALCNLDQTKSCQQNAMTRSFAFCFNGGSGLAEQMIKNSN